MTEIAKTPSLVVRVKKLARPARSQGPSTISEPGLSAYASRPLLGRNGLVPNVKSGRRGVGATLDERCCDSVNASVTITVAGWMLRRNRMLEEMVRCG